MIVILRNLMLIFICFCCSYDHLLVCNSKFKCRMNNSHNCCIGWMWQWVTMS